VAVQVLNRLGVDLLKARAAVQQVVTRGDAATPPREIVLDARTKKAIELAIDEARKLRHKYVGTEHLLLALVREEQDIAFRVLESLGATAQRVRDEVMAVLAELPAEGEAAIAHRDTSPFGRFDDLSKLALVHAHEEAVRIGHGHVGTEHLVVALARSEGETIKRVLAQLEITPEVLRAEIAKAAPPRDRTAAHSELTMTPRLKRAIENAGVEAHARRADRVLPEHLLLALLAEGDDVAANALASLGITKERVRDLLDRPPPA
jgi:ATP-dependent Clp protease ATP-binding subunit ClpA